MKIRVTKETGFADITQGYLEVKIRPGTYLVEIRENPTGKNTSNWYIFTKPEEINPKLKGRIIGATICFVIINGFEIIK